MEDWMSETQHTHTRRHDSALLKRKDLEPDLGAQACNPNYFRGLGRKITNSRLSSEFKASLGKRS